MQESNFTAPKPQHVHICLLAIQHHCRNISISGSGTDDVHWYHIGSFRKNSNTINLEVERLTCAAKSKLRIVQTWSSSHCTHSFPTFSVAWKRICHKLHLSQPNTPAHRKNLVLNQCYQIVKAPAKNNLRLQHYSGAQIDKQNDARWSSECLLTSLWKKDYCHLIR